MPDLCSVIFAASSFQAAKIRISRAQKQIFLILPSRTKPELRRLQCEVLIKATNECYDSELSELVFVSQYARQNNHTIYFRLWIVNVTRKSTHITSMSAR